MEWMESIKHAVYYIEEHLQEDISISDIAEDVYLSPYYFQKGFSMLCGITVGEYIKKRRLTLAASELISSDEKVIDIALKYGYESPDSFTKAFSRFHGATPSAVRKEGALMKAYAPLKIKFILEGGTQMNYKIEKKSAFKVMGVKQYFTYENSKTEIPVFWSDYYTKTSQPLLCGYYGICVNDTEDKDGFDYYIADPYNESTFDASVWEVKDIPAHTWAIFPCKGAMPNALQSVSQRIYSEWLPNSKDYVLAEGYDIEMYSDISKYPKGNQDENYYSEIWIPVKKKA